MKLAPGAPEPYARRASTYYLKGDADLALADYGKAIGIDPRPEFHAERALAFLKAGRLREAFRDAAHARKLLPYDARALTVYGMVLEALGRRTEAIFTFRWAHMRSFYTAESLDELKRLGAY